MDLWNNVDSVEAVEWKLHRAKRKKHTWDSFKITRRFCCFYPFLLKLQAIQIHSSSLQQSYLFLTVSLLVS